MKGTDDPYKGMLNLFSNMITRLGIQNGAAVGLVVSGPPNIAIKYNGMTLTRR